MSAPKNPWLGGRKLCQSSGIPPQSKEYEENRKIFLLCIHSCLSTNVFPSTWTGSNTSMAALGGEERYTAEIRDMARCKHGIRISGLMEKKGYGATVLLVPLYPSVSKSTPNY